MILCKVCSRPDCLGPGSPGHREGRRCIGTLDTECDPYTLPEEELEFIVEYQLECFRHGREGLPFNGRKLLSLIKEVRDLRQQLDTIKTKIWQEENGY